jgi:ATP-dependent RNA helicase DDX51/DBP6
MTSEGTKTHEDTSKGKTKAKLRYLKQKKLRRKQRKTQGASTATDDKRGARSVTVQDDEENDEDDSALEDPRPVADPLTPLLKKHDPKPKKRRRTREKEPNGESEADFDREESIPPDLEGALPSFPLPSLPSAPSAEVLALQGADPALLSAKHVSHGEQLPITLDESDSTLLSLKTRTRLQELGITELFAVQTAIVPFLLSPGPAKWLYSPYDPPPDVCVSAPTGSGKTLAYVLPIIECLSTRIITRLRALVVLPTRDLVVQVRETFEAVGKGRGLKIAGVTGHQSFAHEQSQLVASRSTEWFE